MSQAATVHSLFSEPQRSPQSRFNELWKLWPRKEGKVLAKARYDAIIKGCTTRTLEKDSGTYVHIELQASEDEIIKAAKAYLASQIDLKTFQMKDGGKYIPHLNTWLNKGKFYDYQE